MFGIPKDTFVIIFAGFSAITSIVTALVTVYIWIFKLGRWMGTIDEHKKQTDSRFKTIFAWIFQRKVPAIEHNPII
jgi:hypothetical protein